MTEEPSTAAVAAESLSLPGWGHRECGKHLAQVSPNLMHTQKTHVQTIPSAAPFTMAEEEGVSNRALTPVSRQGREQQGQEWMWKLLVPGAELGLSIPSCFLVISLQLSVWEKENGEHKSAQNEALSTASHADPVLQWRNRWQGPAGCSWVHPKAFLHLLKALVAHRSPAPCGNREETQCITPPSPKAADPSRNSSPSQLSGWAEPSFTTSQPLWQGVSQGEERQTHPATDRGSILHGGVGKEASSTALHTDVWPPTAQEKTRTEVLVLVSSAAR